MQVVENVEISPMIYQMSLMAPEVARAADPGQFLHLRCSESYSPLLRRPISIAGADKGKGTLKIIYRVVGEGTRWLSRRKPGEVLDVLGPLGRGFPLKERPVLVGGGLGVAPLMFLARRIAETSPQGSPRSAYIGFSTAEEAYGVEDLKSWGFEVTVTTDDGSLGKKGFPTDYLETELMKDNTLYACGPLPLLAKVKALGDQKDIPTYISLEERMACGIGACIGCSVKSSGQGYLKVCKDGPVFEAHRVILGGEDGR
jgi:dihydroorotate dehydrogenase electron transfer subunit